MSQQLINQAMEYLNANQFSDYIQFIDENFDLLDEDNCAFLVGHIYEYTIEEGITQIDRFVAKFPHSLHAIRIYSADIAAINSDYDFATNEARSYLRQVNDANLLSALDQHPIIHHAVSRAFLLLTCAYTELGARSYSLTCLSFAKTFVTETYWLDLYENKKQQLSQELEQAELQQLDNLWQKFHDGKGDAEALIKLCEDKNYLNLAKRIDLINANFKVDPTFAVDQTEIFKLVYSEGEQSEEASFHLG